MLSIVKKTYKKDIVKWLLQYYDPEYELTHYDYIKQLLTIIKQFCYENDLQYPTDDEVFQAKFISYLYYNSSHKRYKFNN